MNAQQTREAAVTPVDLSRTKDFALGSARVRPAAREIDIGGKTERLQPRVMEVLVALARAQGAVVSRDDLIEACWEGLAVGEDAVNRVIGKLRRLAELAPDAFAIETVSKVGYRLIADPPPTRRDDPTIKLGPRTDAWAAPTRWLRGLAKPPIWAPAWLGGLMKRPLRLGLSLALFLAVGLLALAMRPHRERVTPPRIAVLPFETQSTDPDARFLAQGITPAIAYFLNQSGVEVVAQYESAAYGGEERAALRELRADYVIDGVVRREADRVIVTARLNDARRGAIVASNVFDEPASAAGAIPQQIATAFVSQFSWTGALRVLGASNGDGLNIAQGFLRTAAQLRALDFAGACHSARQLANSAPNVAQAQQAMAINCMQAMHAWQPSERAGLLRQARAAARRARDLAPRDGDSFVAQQATIPEVDWAERESLMRAAIAADPTNGSPLDTLRGLLLNSGRNRLGAAVAAQAYAANPLSYRTTNIYAYALFITGRREDALDVMRRSLRIMLRDEATTRVHFYIEAWGGAPERAEAMLGDPEIAAVIAPTAEHATLLAITRAMRRRSSADIDTVERDCTNPAKLSRTLGQACLPALGALGRLEGAFRMTDIVFPELRGRDSTERDSRWLSAPGATANAHMLFAPPLASMRADPRFIPLVERQGLVDYWRASRQWPDFCEDEPQSVCARIRTPSTLVAQQPHAR